MITIVDYGMGNLCSVSKALDHLGADCRISNTPEEIGNAERLIVPGVGAFGDAMAELNRCGLVAPIRACAAAGKPVLGICLGMQIFLERSEESPGSEGLGLIPGVVKRFRVDEKVPHMGWNTLNVDRPAPILKGLPAEPYVYFVHSYYADVAPEAREAVAAHTHYGIDFPAVLWHENIQAAQFHPEKSQSVGLAMLANFAR